MLFVLLLGIVGFPSSAFGAAITIGNPNDLPLVGDWEGNGRDQLGVYRPSNSTFYLVNGAGIPILTASPGRTGDLPLVGDWEGSGRDQIGFYRPSTRTFYLCRLSNSCSGTNLYDNPPITYGNTGDVPIVGDWDGSGRDEIGVYRPSDRTFYLHNSDGTTSWTTYGNTGDVPIIGDWDGGRRDEIGVYNPGNRTFYMLHASGVTTSVTGGNPGDMPIVGDWNGSGADQLGEYRPSNETFYADTLPSPQSSTFNWYYPSNIANCVQTGTPGAPNPVCTSAGDNYFSGAAHTNSNQAGGSDSQYLTSGDYCNYYAVNPYRLGLSLNTLSGYSFGALTGFYPPNPRLDQWSLATNDAACQAYGSTWGQYLSASSLAPGTTCPCGVQHWASTAGALTYGSGDSHVRPWSSAFVGPDGLYDPSLILTSTFTIKSSNGGNPWAFLCPIFQDMSTGPLSPTMGTRRFIEACMTVWGAGPVNSTGIDSVSSTNVGGDYFATSGTTVGSVSGSPSPTFATQQVGSATTFTGPPTGATYTFAAAISTLNVENIARAINDQRDLPYSTNPADYALVGVEQGVESSGLPTSLGASESGLTVYTTY